MTGHAYFRNLGQCSRKAPICLGCADAIRELEAELAYITSEGYVAALDRMRARAEKAEARAAELERELKVYLAHIASCRDLPGQPKAREREAEARVAELLEAIRRQA